MMEQARRIAHSQGMLQREDWVTNRGEHLTNLMMTLIQERNHPDYLPLDLLLTVMLNQSLILKEAEQEVKMLLMMIKPKGSRMPGKITLQNLATLDRQLAMKERAVRLGTWPLLMDQTSHRETMMNSEAISIEELTSPSQRIFLTPVPLKMLWI
jgi:hypothetical protein